MVGGTADATCKLQWGRFCTHPWEESERMHNLQCFTRSRPYL